MTETGKGSGRLEDKSVYNATVTPSEEERKGRLEEVP